MNLGGLRTWIQPLKLNKKIFSFYVKLTKVAFVRPVKNFTGANKEFRSFAEFIELPVNELYID